MSVLPPDLPRLRTLVTYLRGELKRTEAALAAAEEAETQEAVRRLPPEPPAWLIERGIGTGRPAIRLHVGGCWDTGKRSIPATTEQVRHLLTEGVPACPHCRPDTALGVLE
ncbi:DUF6233 domain-containing protein [Streptomyces sp. NPDC093225]|uniref:DUF6233 domain-containing protein n=1 Tax=Streptomyces sp. NPDC093225 TaxID=3366034 RepID=UPI00380C5842